MLFTLIRTLKTGFLAKIALFTIILATQASSASKEPIVYIPFELENNSLVTHGEDKIKTQLPASHIKTVPGIIGRGVEFDGEDNQEVQLSSEPLLKLQKELTISTWVKPIAFDRSRFQTVISRGWNWELRLKHQGSVEVRFLGYPEKKYRRILQSPQEIPTGEWTHIVYTFSLSRHTAALYVNGEKKDERTNVDFPLWDMEKNKLLVGMSPGNYNLYHGAVDELRIYDRALDLTEIKNLYSQEGKAVFLENAKKMEATLNSAQSRVNNKSENALSASYQNARASINDLKEKSDADAYAKAISSMQAFTDALYYSDMASHSGKQGINDAVLFVIEPFSSRPILPKTQIVVSEMGGKVSLQGSPSEMLTGSFVIRPTKKDTENLIVSVTDLKSTEGNSVISSSDIDIRIVKAWYQAGTAWSGIDFDSKQSADTLKRILVPELLLHDASLVKVDYEKERNYLRLTNSEGSRYVNVSERKQPEVTDEEYKRSFINIPVERFPVADDAKTLQPLDIPQNDNQQFWLNIKLPENATAGIYHGKLLVKSTSGVRGEIDLEVRVLPIKLGTPKTHYDPDRKFYMSVYYRGVLSPDGKAYIGSEYRSKTQFEAEMRNLRDHGIDFVSNKSPLTEPENLDLSLAIQQKYLGGNILFNTGTGYNLGARLDDSEESLAALRKRSEQLKKAAQKHGYDTIYTYAVDELEADKVAKEKKIWDELHKAGIKVYVAGNSNIADRFSDTLDILVSGGALNKEAAKKMHHHDNLIFSYANPQAGPENPKLFRTNYGIKLWKHNYDSSMTYQFQSAFGTPWNDFDSHASPYRNINFTYPTSNGTVDTIAWEGYAQAYKDVKYASKLAELTRHWKVSDNANKKQVAEEADKYIEDLNISLDTDLDQVRNKIIEYILQLKN